MAEIVIYQEAFIISFCLKFAPYLKRVQTIYIQMVTVPTYVYMYLPISWRNEKMQTCFLVIRYLSIYDSTHQ